MKNAILRLTRRVLSIRYYRGSMRAILGVLGLWDAAFGVAGLGFGV